MGNKFIEFWTYDSVRAYSSVAYVLGGVDLLVFFQAVYQLFQIVRSSWDQTEDPNEFKKHSERKIFHVIIMCTMLIKGCFFLSYPILVKQATDMNSMAPQIVWKHIGSFFFLLAYVMLLIYWQDFYYRLSGGDRRIFKWIKDKLVYIMIIVIFIVLTLSIIAIFAFRDMHQLWKLDDSVGFTLGILSVIIALHFIYYGIRLFFLFKKYRVLRRTQIQTGKVIIIVLGCIICFLARATIEIYSVWYDLHHQTEIIQIDTKTYQQWTGPWFLIFIFYFIFETVPAFAMLVLLRKANTTSSSVTRTERTALLN